MANIDPIHPGEHLAEFLDELGISQYRLAKVIGTPPRRINEIVHGRRSITADTAVRLRVLTRFVLKYTLRAAHLELGGVEREVRRSGKP